MEATFALQDGMEYGRNINRSFVYHRTKKYFVDVNTLHENYENYIMDTRDNAKLREMVSVNKAHRSYCTVKRSWGISPHDTVR